MISFDPQNNTYLFNCPHCGSMIQVEKNQIRCTIFRHGYYKETNQQIPPHGSKQLCDQLFSQGKIYGCGKPFRFDGKKVQKCDYI